MKDVIAKVLCPVCKTRWEHVPMQIEEESGASMIPTTTEAQMALQDIRDICREVKDGEIGLLGSLDKIYDVLATVHYSYRVLAEAKRWRHIESLMVQEHAGPIYGWTLPVVLPGDDPSAAVDASM